MCDTDLYSIILSLNNTSKEFIKSLDIAPENMVSGPVFYDEEDEEEKEQNTEEPVEDENDSTEAKDSENVTLLDSVMEHEENLSEEEKKKRAIRVRHRYVQDLYRFYTLSPMRKAFDNPFEVQKEIPFFTTGLFAKPVDSHDNILQHNQAALRLLDTDVLTHMNQVKGKLKDEHLAKHETQAMLKDKHVRIIALSDVSHELSNQEVDSWIKLIRVLTHEIMNTITPVTSLSETLLTRVTEDKDLKQGLETIHKTGTELLTFVNNYRRFTHVPQPQPTLFYVEPFLERMALLCNHEVEIEVSPKELLVYADESLLSHVVTNLLKNAVEAFREKEREDKQECRSADLQSAASKKAFIRLQAYANAQESIIIDVSNNAGLIPEDVASHIFIPFFTTKPEGSGIGLSLSRQIMRVSGGSLSLHQDKAQGITTFRIIIP